MLPTRRKIRLIFPLLLILTPAACGGENADRWKIVAAFPQLHFDKPLFLTYPPDDSDRLFLVEQDGYVYWFENRKDAAVIHTALEMPRKVRRINNEEGLLGLAFHPDFHKNGRVFLVYSAGGPRRNVLSRFIMDDTRKKILPPSERVILEVDQPYGNHNGGMIAFGPDGHLYYSLGDGGAGGDPHDNGQNLGTLLGKILRIDVDKPSSGKRYSIPPDNPFISTPGARAEIWAYGLRNVWRFSFDRNTKVLWAGDVGQDAWEEIDIIRKGRNYGWNRREGFHPFRPKDREEPPEDPIVEHNRREAQSITGGYVYRGRRFPELAGAYIYGDFITGNIWMLRYESGQVTEHKLIARGELISSFGEDQNGEIYFTSFDGHIYTLSKE